MSDGNASIAHVLGCLRALEVRIRFAVRSRIARDGGEDDRFRGLYITEQDVERLLASRPTPPIGIPEAAALREQVERTADEAEAAGADLRLRRTARAFGLDRFDADVLLVALAPDLDPRFERLYAYLHDDVTKRRATTGLAIELCGEGIAAGAARSRLLDSGALRSGALLLIEDEDRPFLGRDLRVPDRVTAHLLGDDTPDPSIAALMMPADELAVGDGGPLAGTVRAGRGPGYVRERIGTAGRSLAAAAIADAGLVPLSLDLRRLPAGARPEELALLAQREARLRGAGLIIGPIEALAAAGPAAVRAFAESPCPTVLVGARGWDPEWSCEPAFVVDAPVPSFDERRAMWMRALDGDRPVSIDPASTTIQFRLTPEQVGRAATVARRRAAATGSPITPADLREGARAQNAAGLDHLARRVEPRAGWQDVILPTDTLTQLRELAAMVIHRERVLDEWAMAWPTRGRGITALFAGDSGTGKTLSAEVVAAEVGLDLYVIDLSTVVDKYVGETEKNLDRIFVEADRVNGVLVFDEADALFGKRSEVRESKDRWANVEVAYLLQRMERFDGMAILTTNLRTNLDDAFLRRLDVVIDFPVPDEELRRRLWELNLRRGVPTADDIDVGFLAGAFRISGGNIRNVVMAAAYLAATEARALGMTDLVRATRREYQKLGRMCVEAEFGPYYSLVASAG
jgi:hypothetical protein